jgi:hypothetical protein
MNIWLPRIFVQDREDRGLPTGFVRWSAAPGQTALCAMDPELFKDMLSDAEYQGWHTDSGPASVVASARRAYAKLAAA